MFVEVLSIKHAINYWISPNAEQTVLYCSIPGGRHLH